MPTSLNLLTSTPLQKKLMDSSPNESSMKVHLLGNQQLSPPKLIRRKKTLVVSFIIILLIIACFVILSSIIKKTKLSQTLYQSNSSKFYCHLTRYPELCYKSISSIINATDLESNPAPIFSASIQASFNEVSNVTIAITRALSFTTNDSLSGPGLQACKARVLDSVSRINDSLTLLSSDPGGVESLSYGEMEKLQGWNLAARKSALECSLEMEKIGDEENRGVDEVKLGVEIAIKCIRNSLHLLYRRDRIFSEFYSPVTMERENWDLYELYYSRYDYRFLVGLYSGMYLFIALLYFVFWRNV